MEITEEKVSEEQGGFWKGRGSVDQIVILKMIAEEFLRKDRILYATCMDLGKAYDMIDWETV